MILGALQINRPKGPEFKQDELNLMQGLAGVVAVSLISFLRSEKFQTFFHIFMKMSQNYFQESITIGDGEQRL